MFWLERTGWALLSCALLAGLAGCSRDEISSGSGGCGPGARRVGARCVSVDAGIPDASTVDAGACQPACSNGAVCVEGRCELRCGSGALRCGDVCIAAQFDPAHCGSCDRRCALGQVCWNGECAQHCGSGTTECDGRCVDTDLDPRHCGACGAACTADQVCSNGTCSTSCRDSVRCGNVCVDPLRDPRHCGACGNSCESGQICANGACRLACEENGLTRCGSVCADLTSSEQNCGTCFTSCATDRQCVAGQCVCAPGKTQCGEACVDTTTDVLNCGGCGTHCAHNEACTGGTCACAPGKTRCGASCIDVGIASQHCGACGVTCPVGKVCTRGTCEVAAGEWATLQHDVEHSGRTAVNVGVPPLQLAWTRRLLPEGSDGAAHPPVIADGRVFVAVSTYFGAGFSGSAVHALNPSDGTQLWKHAFDPVYSVGQPAVFSGSLYVATSNHTPDTWLWSFDARTGTTQWKAPMVAQWAVYWAPIRVGARVYANGGYYGGMYAFHAEDGRQLFFTNDLDFQDHWSPGYFDGHLFTYVQGKLRKHAAATGAVLSTTSLDWLGNLGSAPVFGSGRVFATVHPKLAAVDPSTGEISWSVAGDYRGLPAVADGKVYVLSGGSLAAVDAETGTQAWSFAGDGALDYPPVIAGQHVYVASGRNVYAIDRATRQQVWTAGVGGWLVIGAQRLFVISERATVHAFAFSSALP